VTRPRSAASEAGGAVRRTFCRYLRSLHPAGVRIAIVLDSFSPHLSTKTDSRVGDWAAANNVELAYVPFYGSWLSRIEAQFTALRYFALDGTDHHSHAEQASMIRRYIAWRNGTPPPIPGYVRSSPRPRRSRSAKVACAARVVPGSTGLLSVVRSRP
jgi:transposase